MRIFFAIGFCFLYASAIAQFQMTLSGGLNFVRMHGGGIDNQFAQLGDFGYRGVSGAETKKLERIAPTMGIELETYFWRKTLRQSYVSLVSGVYYLQSGYELNDSEEVQNIKYPIQSSMNLNYLSIPLLLRLNIQPNPLYKKWIFFVGAGLTVNRLLQGSINEVHPRTTEVFDFTRFDFVYNTSLVEDSADLTILKNSNYLFSTFELGTSFRRVKVLFRYRASLQDMYFTGIENEWKLKQQESVYLSSYASWGKMLERNVEFLVGFNLFNNK
jgi:hypothetical protein